MFTKIFLIGMSIIETEPVGSLCYQNIFLKFKINSLKAMV